MRVVLQRCKEASVTIAGELKSAIGEGMLILLGDNLMTLKREKADMAFHIFLQITAMKSRILILTR